MSGRGRSPRRHLSTVAAEGAIAPSGGTPPGLPRGVPHRNPLLTGCPPRSRSLGDPDDPASSPALAPTELSLQELATVAATRWVAEPCLKEAKGESGLDQDEVWRWSSRHRHLTSSMPAGAWPA